MEESYMCVELTDGWSARFSEIGAGCFQARSHTDPGLGWNPDDEFVGCQTVLDLCGHHDEDDDHPDLDEVEDEQSTTGHRWCKIQGSDASTSRRIEERITCTWTPTKRRRRVSLLTKGKDKHISKAKIERVMEITARMLAIYGGDRITRQSFSHGRSRPVTVHSGAFMRSEEFQKILFWNLRPVGRASLFERHVRKNLKPRHKKAQVNRPATRAPEKLPTPAMYDQAAA